MCRGIQNLAAVSLVQKEEPREEMGEPANRSKPAQAEKTKTVFLSFAL